MKTNYTSEITISIILIILTILLLNPFKFWMPTSIHMVMLVAMVVIFIFFAAFIWKERSADEREQIHKSIAGRWAYLIGSAILVVGIILQTIQHILDPWLVIALVGMVLTKLGSYIYAEMNN
jgi:hypothetical protein